MKDGFEVAELTCENGQLAMHGLIPPRVPNKPLLGTWEFKIPYGGGTLESIVNQATGIPPDHHQKFVVDVGVDGGGDRGDDLVRWFDNYVADTQATTATMAVDDLVPTSSTNTLNSHQQEPPSSTHVPRITSKCIVNRSTRVASCSDAVNRTDGEMERTRVGAAVYEEISKSFDITESFEDGEVKNLIRSLYQEDNMLDRTTETGERDLGAKRFTSTSMGSPERTSKHCTSKTVDNHESGRAQRETGDEDEKKGSKISSFSTKRSRAAATHNQSERKRRDKINQRLKTLQKLVPTSSKTDKASMLDDVIEYLKQLQGQVEAMRGMNNHVNMMLPKTVLQQQQQQLQMSMMGMGGLPNNITAMPSVFHTTSSSFIPIRDRITAPSLFPPDPLASFHLASQSQPMTVEAYKRMAALYQQQYLQSHANLGFKN